MTATWRACVLGLCAIAIFGQLALSKAGSIAAIIGASVAVLTVTAGIVVWARKRVKLRRCVRGSYLIPMAHYPAKSHEGAPAAEQYPDALAVGMNGSYAVPHRLTPNQAVEVLGIRVEFWGPADERPVNRGLRNPMVVESANDPHDRAQVRDWWGVLHPDGPTLPTHCTADDCIVVGHLVQTHGAWEGTMRLHVQVRAFEANTIRVRVIDMPLRVGSDDDIPFLRE